MEIPVTAAGFQTQKLSISTAGLWGGPRLLLNGQKVEGKRGQYSARNDAGQDVAIEMKNIVVDPIPKLTVGGVAIELARPLAWYEYAWMGLPFLMAVGGGAFGAGFGMAAIYTNARIFRSDRSTAAKYGLTGLVSFGALAAFLVVAFTLQLLLRSR